MKTLFLLLLSLFAAIGASAQQVAQIKEIFLKSKYFDHERQVLIYTPVGYNEFTATYYDVIYVFDAQNRSQFDLVHAIRNYVCSSDPDESKSFIVVGICSLITPNSTITATPITCQCRCTATMDCLPDLITEARPN